MIKQKKQNMETLKNKIKNLTPDQFENILKHFENNNHISKYLFGMKLITELENFNEKIKNLPVKGIEYYMKQYNTEFKVQPDDKLYTHTRKSFKDDFENEVITKFQNETGILLDYNLILTLLPSTRKIVLFDGTGSNCNCDFDIIQEFNTLYETRYDYNKEIIYPYDRAMTIIKTNPELRFDIRFINLIENNKDKKGFTFLKIGLIPDEAFRYGAFSIDIEFMKNCDEFLNIHYTEIYYNRIINFNK